MGIFDDDRELKAVLAEIKKENKDVNKKLDDQNQAIGRKLDDLKVMLTALKEQGNAIMSKENELKAALDDLGATLTRVSTDIENQLAIINKPGTPDAAVDAAIARIGEINNSLKQKAADLEADDASTGG